MVLLLLGLLVGLIGAAIGKAQFRADLSGVDIRLCDTQNLPLLWTERDPFNGTVLSRRGLAVELFNYLVRALNITYSYVEIKEQDIRTYGVFQACTNALLEDKLDVVTKGGVLSPVVYQILDVINTPVGAEEFRFTVPYPEVESKIFGLLHRVFGLTVWLWTIAAVIVTPIALHWLSVGYHRFVNQNCPIESVSDYSVYIAAILFYQGNWIRLRQHSLRLAIGLFSLAAIILVNGYASKMTANLSVPKLQPIINSVQDMADSTSLKMLVDVKAPLVESILEAKNGTLKTMGDLVRVSSSNDYIYTNEDAFKKMMTKRYAFFQVDVVSFPFIHSTYKAAGRRCIFTISKSLGFHPSYHLYVPKLWPYMEPINAQWLMLWNIGIWQFLNRQYRPNIEQCLVHHQNYEEKVKGKPLNKPSSLKDLSGSFLLLFAGLSLSLFGFLIEHCCCHR